MLAKVAVWAMPLAIGYLTWWALSGGGLGDAWNASGEGGLSVWQAIDTLVGATSVSWVPLAADYTRFARTPRAAFWGPGIGCTSSRTRSSSHSAPSSCSPARSATQSALPAAVAAGGTVALLTLVVLTVAETDEAFANAYSGAMSLQNLFPRAPQRLLIVATTGIGVIGASTLELTSFRSPSSSCSGPFFAPLFAVLLADWLLSGLRYGARGTSFGAPAWRAGMLAAWLVGFATYQYLSPTGPAWWVDQVGSAESARLGHRGARKASFVASLFGGGCWAAAVARLRDRALVPGG